MSIIRSGFFAYASNPGHSGEFIERALKEIRLNHGLISLESWRNLPVTGNLIITDILRKIEECDFFCADLTGMNDNVLFEIGFAIGKKKPIWLIQDTSVIASYNRFKELNLFTTIGYASYTSSDDIIRRFSTDKVFERKNDLVISLFATVDRRETDNIMLYLKSQYNTDYNKYIIQKIEEYNFTCIVDDPDESKVQSLSWYLEQLLSTPVALVEFSSTNKFGHEIQNSKCALVAGIAYGLGVKLQMIAQEYYETPIDYRELLKKFHNQETCKKAVEPFFTSVRSDLLKLIRKKNDLELNAKHQTLLQQINFGQSIAEHEANDLSRYYVEFVGQKNLLKNEYNIVVGRKGTGKTASLYYLYNKLVKNVKNKVCLINPINFEFNGILSILQNLKDEFERGYLIESVWKFLIYSEVMKLIYNSTKGKELYALTENDQSILDFVNRNERIILTDFSSRLEQELDELRKLRESKSQHEFRLKTSEILHDGVIKEMLDLIISHLNKKNGLIILIDNLDKSWQKGIDIVMLSKLLFGLLSVAGRIARDFKGKPNNPNPFEFNLVIFIRSDIFKSIIKNAREPDKLEFTKLVWDDGEILLRVINERINSLNTPGKVTADMFWRDLIVPVVEGVSTHDYVFSNIIPRPRDLIMFFNMAKEVAVMRGHDKIEEMDLVKALKDYSAWLFTSIIVENGITFRQMQDFLYSFLGEPAIFDLDVLKKSMGEAKIEIKSAENLEYFIDRLTSLSFIGREIKANGFQFVYDFETDEKNRLMALKFGSNRFRIHNAFVPYLEAIV